MKSKSDIIYPQGKDFIFSIYDDTDVATLDSIRPIYDYLNLLNIKTTKSVWPLGTNLQSSYRGSDSLENENYATYIKKLHDRGFEISFHSATMVSSRRKKIDYALKLFYDILKFYPRSYTAHAGNRENIYSGSSKFTTDLLKKAYKILYYKKNGYYQGHIQDSEFFWGDMVLKYFDYVRNFVFDEINLLNIGVIFPYTTSFHPWVKYWFFTSDADNVAEFNRLISEKNQQKLEDERGICIISTHFGKGFVKEGRLNDTTKKLLKKISNRNGWFVPVSEVLDFMRKKNSNNEISSYSLLKLELKFIFHSFLRYIKSQEYEKSEIDYLEKKCIKF
jgi:hypothetical protein